MANPEHLKILKQSAEVWNNWRTHNSQIKPDFRNAPLNWASLSGRILTGADLTEAQLYAAELELADIKEATLVRANLQKANLSSANLRNANLQHAVLHSTILSHTNLREADLARAYFGSTILSNLDLSETIGLETARHIGPSTIGIDTLYLSQGKIPEVFLRGCGLTDEMIEFARSLTGHPIEFNSCFISYSTKDEEFAQRLYNDLQAKGVRCWFAPHDVKGGKKLHEQIDWAIHYHDRLLLLLSPDSINSEWVRREIDKARKKEAEENRDVLFPISLVHYKELQKWEYLDSDTGKDVAKEIRSFFIPDFSNWKDHDSYQAAFKKLLEDLKGERAKAAPVTK